MPQTLKREILKRAVDQVGIEELAVRLRAPVPLIEAWAQGQATMPDRKFLLLVDLMDELSAS